MKGAFTGALRQHRGPLRGGPTTARFPGRSGGAVAAAPAPPGHSRKSGFAAVPPARDHQRRIIAATNRRLENAPPPVPSDRSFYASVFSPSTSPAPGPGNDIILLADHFVIKHEMNKPEEIATPVIEAFLSQLAGNVRELENCISVPCSLRKVMPLK